MYRRYMLTGVGVVLASLLAKLGGADEDLDQHENGEEVEAVVGKLIEGDELHLVVEGVDTTTEIDEFTEADEGNEFLIVDLAYQNVSDEAHSVSGWLQTRVHDDEDYSYDQSLFGTDQSLDDGEIVPGEVERGNVVYEVPADADGFVLDFDFELGLFGPIERVTIDLERESDEVHVLEQDLAVEIHGVGDEVDHDGTTVTVNDVETATELDAFTDANEGYEYAIVDVTVANATGEEQTVSTILQMQMKDGEGFAYGDDLGATVALDRAFDHGTPLADGDQRRGQIPYVVEEDITPLYWVFEFSLVDQGDKTFWQVR